MKIKLLLFIFFILVLLLQPVLAKSYSYDYVKTNLDFGSDGSVVVRQERDYDFRGSFSYAYLDILKKGSTNVRFLGIVDLDTNESLIYALEDDSTHIKATWHYTANDQVKRFLIIYKIEDIVKRYEDVADFYWKVIEDNHENIERFESYVNLPSRSNLFKVFVHSSASPGKLDFLNDLQTAKVTMQNIPANTFVEFRVLAEPSIFSEVEQISSKNYENILNEEKTIFYSVTPLLPDINLMILLSALPIIAFIIFYLKYGRNPRVNYEMEYEREPPNKIPPMALSNLLEGEESKTGIKTEAMGLIATIFDLARRGYLDVNEEKKKRFLGLGEKTEQRFTLTKKGRERTDELRSFENEILQLILFCGDGSTVTSSEIVDFCRGNPYLIKNRIEEIDENSRKWFESKYYKITEKISSDVRKKFAYIIMAYIFMSAISFYYFKYSFLFLPIVISIFVLVIAVAMSKRTYESALEIKKWKAFKRFISDFSAMKDAPLTLLKIWDEYLIYAIAFGVAEKLLENLKKLSIETGRSISAIAWYHGISPIPGRMISPENITSFVNNLSHTVNALSSSTSVGGGFSGGGGGGGGGGSSGAG